MELAEALRDEASPRPSEVVSGVGLVDARAGASSDEPKTP
jgi:hypothetical protein